MTIDSPDPRLRTVVRRGGAYVTFRRERFILHGRASQRTHTGLYLNEVYVPPGERGKGVAREMLATVLEQADANQTCLFLEPTEADGLAQDQLVWWYKRHGFARLTGNLYMRTPTPAPKRPLLSAIARWLTDRAWPGDTGKAPGSS